MGIQVIAVNPAFADDPSQQRASSLTQIDPPVPAVLVYVDRPRTMEAVDLSSDGWSAQRNTRTDED